MCTYLDLTKPAEPADEPAAIPAVDPVWIQLMLAAKPWTSPVSSAAEPPSAPAEDQPESLN